MNGFNENKKNMKDMKDIKLKSNALHFLSYDMNLDWLHCIVPNPKLNQYET